MFLKNRNISSKIKRSKITEYAALSAKNIVLYPYSTQATNRPNRRELTFFLFGGIREVSLIFLSNRDVLRVSPDSDTMSLRIFGNIGSIRLESRKNSLRLAK